MFSTNVDRGRSSRNSSAKIFQIQFTYEYYFSVIEGAKDTPAHTKMRSSKSQGSLSHGLIANNCSSFCVFVHVSSCPQCSSFTHSLQTVHPRHLDRPVGTTLTTLIQGCDTHHCVCEKTSLSFSWWHVSTFIFHDDSNFFFPTGRPTPSIEHLHITKSNMTCAFNPASNNKLGSLTLLQFQNLYCSLCPIFAAS